MLNRHVPIEHEIFSRLSLYHDLLLKWQSRINLVGPDTIGEAWQRHFLDSLQLLKVMDDKTKRVLDMGTGAGFPGMVLAIAGATDVHLIESSAKKIAFLKEVARVTNTVVTIHHCRIEDRPIDNAQIIVSRACANLDQLLHFSSLYFSHGTICLFPKGKNYITEIDGAKEHWHFESTLIPSVTDTSGVILKLCDIRRRDHEPQRTNVT